MDDDELTGRRRRLEDLQGFATRLSSLGEALEPTRVLAERLSVGRGTSLARDLAEAHGRHERIVGRAFGFGDSLDDGVLSVAARGGIAEQLRQRNAFTASVIGGAIGSLADGAAGRVSGAIEPFAKIDAMRGARDLIAGYQAQTIEKHARIAEMIGGGGGIGDRLAGVELMSATRWIEHDNAGAIARAAQWATALERPASHTLAGLLGASDGVAAQLEALSRAAVGIVEAGGLSERISRVASGAISETTALKVATFAGSLDLFGPRSAAGHSAFESLLGNWQTTSDLPPAFFRDAEARGRRYREADVDEGLIDADNAQIIDVLVETGVVPGERTERGVRAVIEVGPLRMAVTARRARHDAFRTIDAFEIALRGFIETKLIAHLSARGEDASKWFTSRVPGNLVGSAKQTRRAAYQAGETRQPLINFTNLGDLIAIITSTRNWDEVFGPVLGDRDGIKVDLQRLNAHRRPIMHGRPIDGPRLLEIMLTVRRLTALIGADGCWANGWDDDI